MVILLYRSLQKLSLALALAGVACAGVSAQSPRPQTPPPPRAPDALVVESARRQATQVVTIVHRLNGIKALALLRRNGEMVATIDDDLLTTADAVTSITAGFALGDGESVVARLPQAEALAAFQPFSMSWSFVTAPAGAPARVSSGQATTPPPAAARAELVIVQNNGRQFTADYVGLDGGSGLSLLKINGLKVPVARDAREEQLTLGQTLHLFAPVRVARGSNAAPQTVSLRVGEIEGRITEITRTSTGQIAHLSVSAQNLSPAIVGGVALNDAGETVGIVEASEAGRARLIPAAAVRRAAARVLQRRASVPRPWLGVRGEPLAGIPLEKFPAIGWTAGEAMKLKEAYKGIVLTSVAPGTPAALADLRPGDLIVRVNDLEVKSAEDFSYFLNEAGGGANVSFTFFRGPTPKPALAPGPAVAPRVSVQVPPSPAAPLAPPALKPLEVSVKLGEAVSPTRAMRLAEGIGSSGLLPGALPVVARGVETVTLSGKAAAHLGARAGLLVVFVEPESAAARAGLRVFDVIEAVDGKVLDRAGRPAAPPAAQARQLLLGVVRDRQKLEITIQQKD